MNGGEIVWGGHGVKQQPHCKLYQSVFTATRVVSIQAEKFLFFIERNTEKFKEC